MADQKELCSPSTQDNTAQGSLWDDAFQRKDPDAAIARILEHYQKVANHVDYTDGIGLEFDNWRFNLRKSNTEPVVRLNVESREDIPLMEQKTQELLTLLKQ